MKRLLLLASLLSTLSLSYVTQLRAAGDATSLATSPHEELPRGDRFINALVQMHDDARLDVIKHLSAADIKNAYDHLAQVQHPATQEQTGLMNTFQNEARRRLAQKLYCTADSLMDKTCQPLKNSTDSSLTPEERNAQPFKTFQAPWTNDWVYILPLYEQYENKLKTIISRQPASELTGSQQFSFKQAQEQAQKDKKLLPIKFLNNLLIERRHAMAAPALKGALQKVVNKTDGAQKQASKNTWNDKSEGEIVYTLAINPDGSTTLLYGTLNNQSWLTIGIKRVHDSNTWPKDDYAYGCYIDEESDPSFTLEVKRGSKTHKQEEILMDILVDVAKAIGASALTVDAKDRNINSRYEEDIAFLKSKNFELFKEYKTHPEVYRLNLAH